MLWILRAVLVCWASGEKYQYLFELVREASGYKQFKAFILAFSWDIKPFVLQGERKESRSGGWSMVMASN